MIGESAPGHRLSLEKATHGPAPAVQLAFSDLGTPLEEVTFVVVDLETTGGAPSTHSITEFGAVKVRGGEVVGEFATLVNPGIPIPPYIVSLTGITTAMVHDAPDIYAVMPAFMEFLSPTPDTILVAHNARFDVGHLKAAAAGLSIPWPNVMVLDTVRLARRVFTKDEAPNVKLATLARICCTSVTPSHRALDDARATVDVLHTMLGRLGPLGVTHRDDLVTATDPVPPRRRKKAHLAEELPHTPGVYHFIGPGEEVMYVGTSVNVYKRVRQYFTAAESRKRMGEMVDLAVRVDAISTPTVLEAQILELRHIARYDPPYNRRSKRPARAPWLTLTDEAHPRLMVSRKLRMENANTSLGPFSSTVAARKAARLIADEAQLRTCTTVLPAVPLSSASPCHLLSLGKCDAPCVREPPPLSSAARAKDILSGSLDGVWEHQHERLALLAQAERFEQAAEERDRLAVVLNATKNKERFLPFLRASRILAARPAHSSHCWEIMLMQFGKLVGSAVTAPGERPPDVARALAEHVPESVEPEFVGQDASIEESRILLQWLWQEDTRLLEFTGPTPLALPRHSSSRFTLPVAQHGEESDSW